MSMESKEQELTFSHADFNELMKNVQKAGYESGRQAGIELAIKQAKERHGLCFNGKGIDSLIDAVKTKYSKEMSNEQDTSGYMSQIEELQRQAERMKSENEQMKNEFAQQELNNRVSELIPPTSTKLSKKDIMYLLQSDGYTFEDRDGEIVALRHGEVLRGGSTFALIPPSKAINDYLVERDLIKVEPEPSRVHGRTRPPAPGVAYATLKEFESDWIAQGKSTIGAEFMAKAQEYAKDNPDFFNDTDSEPHPYGIEGMKIGMELYLKTQQT